MNVNLMKGEVSVMSDTTLGLILVSFVFGLMAVGLICLAVTASSAAKAKEAKKEAKKEEKKEEETKPSSPKLPEGLRLRLERAQAGLVNAFAEADAAVMERDAALERVRAKKAKRETEKLNASLAPVTESGEAGESASSTKTNGGHSSSVPVVGDDHEFTVPASAPLPHGGKRVRAIIVRTEIALGGGAVCATYRMPCGASEVHGKVSDHLATCAACHAKM